MINLNKILTIIFLITLISCKKKNDQIFDYISDKDYVGLKSLLADTFNVDINYRNKEGKSPLYFAIIQKDYEAVNLLVNNGVKTNEKFGDTISIFGLALLSENENIIQNIYEKNVQIDGKCYKDHTPLDFAVKNNKPKLVLLLLQNNANINQIDSLGNTPIFYSKTTEMLSLLIRNNAKTTIENKKGQTLKQYINNQKIQDYLNQKTTFSVSDVKGAKKLRVETSYINSIRRIVKRYKMPIGGFPEHWDEFKNNYNQKILCISDTIKLIETDYNPFIAAVEFAYYEERPFVISPDMIWLLICQGFSQHIQQNPEKYRDKLVNFQGKKDIIIYRNYIDFADKDNWNSIVHEFAKQTTNFTKDSIYNVISSNFTTTTLKEAIAFQITYLDVLKNYFNYIAFSCGIPSITLEGTPEDWEKIYKNVNYFKQYDLSWWIDSLKPVIQEFVNTSKGKINTDFWKRILKVDVDLYETKHITGWINNFFPYVYKSIYPTESNKLRTPAMLIVENWCLKNNTNKKRPNLVHDNILSGVCLVPFICKDNETEIKMEFAAGFIGIKQDKTTKSLRPEIGWALLKK